MSKLVWMFISGALWLYAGVPETAAQPEQFAPQGWTVLAKAEGDLNRDGQPDVAIAFRNPGEDQDNRDQLPRLLVIALREPGGRWKRAALSEDEILCRTCGGMLGDPFQELAIQRGAVVIAHYGGSRFRWGHTYRYRLEPGGWERIGETELTEDSAQGTARETDRNLVTGRVVETQGRGKREYRELTARRTTAAVPPERLIELAPGLRAAAILVADQLWLYATTPLQITNIHGKPIAPAQTRPGTPAAAVYPLQSLGPADGTARRFRLNSGPDLWLRIPEAPFAGWSAPTSTQPAAARDGRP